MSGGFLYIWDTLALRETLPNSPWSKQVNFSQANPVLDRVDFQNLSNHKAKHPNLRMSFLCNIKPAHRDKHRLQLWTQHVRTLNHVQPELLAVGKFGTGLFDKSKISPADHPERNPLTVADRQKHNTDTALPIQPFSSPNSVSTLWGSYGNFRSGVLRGVLPQPRLSTAQARTEFRLWWLCAVDRRSRDFGWFYPVSVHVLKQNVVLRDRRRGSDGFGSVSEEIS